MGYDDRNRNDRFPLGNGPLATTLLQLALFFVSVGGALMFGFNIAHKVPAFNDPGAAALGLVLCVAAAANYIRLEEASRRRRVVGQVVFTLIFFFVVGAVFAPISDGAREANPRQVCIGRMRQLLRAVTLYAEENDGFLPPNAQWRTATQLGPDTAQCLSAERDWTYALNSTFRAPVRIALGQIVVLIEVDAEEKNAFGELEDVVFRHDGRTNIGIATGQVYSVTREQIALERWGP